MHKLGLFIIRFFFNLQNDSTPPKHMPICHGQVQSRNLKNNNINPLKETCTECLICSSYIKDVNSKLTCLNLECELVSHITCLADLYLVPGEYIPIGGQCPFCDTMLKWGDLIRKMKGCSVETTKGQVVEDKSDCSESDKELLCSQERRFVDNNSHWLLGCDENE